MLKITLGTGQTEIPTLTKSLHPGRGDDDNYPEDEMMRHAEDDKSPERDLMATSDLGAQGRPLFGGCIKVRKTMTQGKEQGCVFQQLEDS